MTQHAEKSALRRQLRAERRALPANERRRATQAANRLLKRYIRRGRRIGVYWPVGGELRLDGLVEAARRRGALLYLPYIEPGSLRLWFTPYPADGREPERRRGRGGLFIPQFGGGKIRAHRLHTLLVPLVGVDRHGYRLGQGGGYYDVSLAALGGRLRPLLLGVGFACQMRDTLPHEAHDVRLDGFVCERGIRRFSGGKGGRNPLKWPHSLFG